MMNLIFLLAFSILLPASTICAGETVSEPPSLYNNKFDSLHSIMDEKLKKSNSTHSLPTTLIVKREIPEANEMPYYHFPNAIMSKRSATVLNKLMFALRNSFDKPASIPMDNELGSRENDNFAGDVSQALAKVNAVDRFPAALVERRGQGTGSKKDHNHKCCSRRLPFRKQYKEIYNWRKGLILNKIEMY